VCAGIGYLNYVRFLFQKLIFVLLFPLILSFSIGFGRFYG